MKRGEEERVMTIHTETIEKMEKENKKRKKKKQKTNGERKEIAMVRKLRETMRENKGVRFTEGSQICE